jgi:hypothetical protein
MKLRQYHFFFGNTLMFNYLRNKVNRERKKLQRSFYEKKMKHLKNENPKQWWKSIKDITGKNNQSNTLVTMANTLCNGSTQQLAGCISKALNEVTSDMKALTPDDNFCKDKDFSVPDKYVISLESTRNALIRIKTNKAMGPDSIPNWLLKGAADNLAIPICAMWNSSLREGNVPRLWKSADICPIEKIPRPMRVDKDLRPISLTAVISKSLESFTRDWVMEFMQDILDEHQYGSLKGCSTTLALIETFHLWLGALEDTGSTVRILFLDFRKAFDRVDHSILLTKLANLGLPSFLVRWLTSFLCQRRQRVKVAQSKSEWSQMTAGVPQGTLLGPTTFLLHINCLQTDCKAVKYVDDATIWVKCERNGANSKLQRAADQAQSWADVNKMLINTEKTKCMDINFGKSQSCLPAITMNNCCIEVVKTSKVLGVVLNDKLTWHDHVLYMIQKTSKRLYLLCLLKRAGLSADEVTQVYCSIIRSVLEYATELWHPGLTNEQSVKIEQVQKRAVHIIKPGMDYQTACADLKLESLSSRRENKCKKFFSDIQNECHKLNYLLPKVRQGRSLRKTKKYPLPKVKTERFKHSPINYGIFNYQ